MELVKKLRNVAAKGSHGRNLNEEDIRVLDKAASFIENSLRKDLAKTSKDEQKSPKESGQMPNA